MKSISKAALALGVALSWPAQAIVIDNGFPEGTPGRFSVNVETGGVVTSAVYTTRRFDSPGVVTVNLVSQYQAFVDPGNDGEGKVLSGGEPFVSTFDGSVISFGSFIGENGDNISWNASSRIPSGAPRLETSYFFSGECVFDEGPPLTFTCPPIGGLRVYQYLDGDMSDGSDVLRVKPGPVLETLGNTSLFGVSQSGLEFQFGSVLAGGAADIFNLIEPRIAGAGQPVSTGIRVENLPAFGHPELGSVRGPGDVVSVLAFDAFDPDSDFVDVSTVLRAVAPPPDPSPPRDSDGDGVSNPSDHCPGTPAGTPVQSNGCPVPDSDGDGVIDTNDDCPRTPTGTPVQANGCPPLDFDGDGVANENDNCPAVANLDQRDTDGDGVGDVCDVTGSTPVIVNRNNVPCRGKRCDVKLACPTSLTADCKNTATIVVDRKFLRLKSSPSSRAGTVKMAAGATSIPAGSVGVIKMKLNRNGRLVVGANRGKKVKAQMTISNSAGTLLSVTPIKMRIK